MVRHPEKEDESLGTDVIEKGEVDFVGMDEKLFVIICVSRAVRHQSVSNGKM